MVYGIIYRAIVQDFHSFVGRTPTTTMSELFDTYLCERMSFYENLHKLDIGEWK